MAKKKKQESKGAPIARGASGLWWFFAKTLGGAIRFIARGARELDPAHQRDGFAFLFFILALVSSAGTWFHSNNLLGRILFSFFYGAVGRIGLIVPLLLLYFAIRLFRVPDERATTGRITIGTLALLLSSTGLIHMITICHTRKRRQWLPL